MTKTRFITQIRWALQAAGIDDTKYAGHSFRIGAATINSPCKWDQRGNDQNAGKMGELSLHDLHENSLAKVSTQLAGDRATLAGTL